MQIMNPWKDNDFLTAGEHFFLLKSQVEKYMQNRTKSTAVADAGGEGVSCLFDTLLAPCGGP